MVIATQNPVDHEGTFPLPEAQLDRFLIKLSLGYPTIEEEALMLKRLQFGHPIDDVVPVVSSADWIACQEVVRKIHLDDQIRTYILEIVHGTRDNENILLGGSPRASLSLQRAAQASAAIQGRTFVVPDDVKKLVAPVLSHRIILKPETRLRKIKTEDVIKDVLDDIPVPVSSDYHTEKITSNVLAPWNNTDRIFGPSFGLRAPCILCLPNGIDFDEQSFVGLALGERAKN